VIDNASNLYEIYYPSVSIGVTVEGNKRFSSWLGHDENYACARGETCGKGGEGAVINTGKICVGSTGVYELVNFPRRESRRLKAEGKVLDDELGKP
jgi:hypothetical protein